MRLEICFSIPFYVVFWYFTKVLQLSWRIPLQESRPFGRDPPHLTRLSRPEEIESCKGILQLSCKTLVKYQKYQLSWDLSAPVSALVTTGFEPQVNTVGKEKIFLKIKFIINEKNSYQKILNLEPKDILQLKNISHIWYFTKVLQLSWRIPLQGSRS